MDKTLYWEVLRSINKITGSNEMFLVESLVRNGNDDKLKKLYCNFCDAIDTLKSACYAVVEPE